MENSIFSKIIEKYKNEYVQFLNIVEFPKYDLKIKNVSLSLADSQGFEVAASAHYLPDADKHILTITPEFINSKYLIFHEFTHIFDAEKYSKNDKISYMGISGFTEYHASQIELVQLIGAKNIDDIPTFSMSALISTLSGEKSVRQYIDEKYNHAISLFSRNDFPANIETLKTAMGVLFNYFGLRSICEMYSNDFNENAVFDSILKFISNEQFYYLNSFMRGWLNEFDVNISAHMYKGIIFPLIKNYKLL